MYAADVAFRMCQSSNVTIVKAWRVVGKGTNRTLVFTLPVDKVVFFSVFGNLHTVNIIDMYTFC